MSRCVKTILDGDDGGCEGMPDVETMSRHWGPFFSQPSAPVAPQPPSGLVQELEYLWDPIMVDEVARITLPLNSALGIDTITVR